jgi:hypothetical protein
MVSGGPPLEPSRARARAGLIGLAAIVALGLVLRLLFLRADSTFQRTDEVMFVLSSLKLHDVVAPSGPGQALRELFWMFAFPWGYPVLLFTWSLLEIVDALGLPIREFTVVAPFAVLGGLAPVLVFLLGRRAFSPAVGLAAAAALAVLPSHVAQSRTIAAWILASDLMMIAVLLFLRYRETRRPRDAWRFSLALAVYLPSDNLAPGALAFLALHLAGVGPGPLRARLEEAWRLIGRREVVLLPAVTLLPLVVAHAVFVVTGRDTYGFIGHYFLDKAAPGLHIAPVVAGLGSNAGWALSVLLALGLGRAVLSLVRRDRGLPFALWFLSFAIPTALIAKPTGNLVGYLTPMLIPLLVLGSAMILEGAGWFARRAGEWPARALAAASLTLLVGWTLASIPSRIYAMDFLVFRSDPIGLWGGEIYGNDGAKTAGYYIRTETPTTTTVLSDVRPLVGKYYFHRRTMSGPDGRAAPAPASEADVLALTRGVGDRLDTTGYHLAAAITHRGREVFAVYTRERRRPRVLATEEFDARFDREFGRVPALRYPVVWGD